MHHWRHNEIPLPSCTNDPHANHQLLLEPCSDRRIKICMKMSVHTWAAGLTSWCRPGMVLFNVQPHMTQTLVLTFFLSPGSLSGSTYTQSPWTLLFLLCFSPVFSLASLAANSRERCSSSSASCLVLFLATSAVSPHERSCSTAASCLEHFVDPHLGRLALYTLTISAEHFNFGPTKQLFSKIYRTRLRGLTQSTPRKSNEMLYKCTETAFMATREVIRGTVPERIHECVEK